MNYALSLLSPSVSKIFSLTFRLKLKYFWIFSLTLTLSLMFFYIFQQNSLISEGYSIQKYQRNLNKLSEETKTLEFNFSQTNSLNLIKSEIDELGFEKVDRVHYLKTSGSQIVKE